MDDKRKYDIKAHLDLDNDESWFGNGAAEMPEEMKMAINEAVSGSIAQTNSSTDKVMSIIVRTVAAACLLSFILFAHEQFYSIRKLNHLEQRIAKSNGSTITPLRTQSEVLIINSFFSWKDIKNLSTTDFETAYKELAPVWMQNNMIDDGQIKLRIQQYLQDYQIAIKIHLP